MMSEKRKFDGKTYTLKYDYGSGGRARLRAQAKARVLRKQGKQARVIMLTRHSRLSEPWLVYVRGRSRKRKRR